MILFDVDPAAAQAGTIGLVFQGIGFIVWLVCFITVIVDSGKAPKEAWQAAGKSRGAWIVLTFFFSWIALIFYFALARPKVRAAAAQLSQGGQGYYPPQG